jgi:hypothetical protein
MSEFTNRDLAFIQRLNSLAKYPRGIRTMTTSRKIVNRLIKLHDKYGREAIHETIDKVKTNGA